MKGKTLLGIALVVLGVISLAYQGITFTTHKKVLDVGPIEATKKEHKTIPLPSVLGAVCLIGGVLIIALDRRSA